MSTKDKQEKIVGIMRKWQKAENAAVSQTAKIIEETDNPLLRLVMEVIQRDSNLHHRVQQTIIDSYEKEALNVLTTDLEKAWDSIDKHIRIEKKTVELGEASLDALKGTRNVVQQYLISYLLEDEKKHDKLLADLALIKKGMYP